MEYCDSLAVQVWAILWWWTALIVGCGTRRGLWPCYCNICLQNIVVNVLERRPSQDHELIGKKK